MRLRSFLTNTRIGSVASQVTYVVSIAAMNIVVVRVWGAAERGDLAVLIVTSTLAATIGGRGFQDVAVWVIGSGHRGNDLRREFRSSATGALITGVLGAAISLPILPWTLAIAVIPSTVLLHVFRSAVAIHLANGEMHRFNVRRVALPLATTLGICIAWPSGLRSPVPGYLLGQLVAVGLTIGPLRSIRGRRPDEPPMPEETRAIRRQSVVGNAIGTSLSRIDILCVAALAPPEVTGVYAVALSVSEVSLTGAYAMSFHALREGAVSSGATAGTIRRALSSTLALSAAAWVAVSIVAVPILGPSLASLPTTFALLVPGLVALSIVRTRYSGDLTAGRGRNATLAMAAATILMLTLDFFLVPAFAEHGAAAASSIAYVSAYVLLARSSSTDSAADHDRTT